MHVKDIKTFLMKKSAKIENKQTNKQKKKTRERCQNFTEEEKNVNFIVKVMKISLTIKNKSLSSIEEIIT